ncbi:hypothetical protein [Foetidibacter luteolus]|uniref:hypothetical protein n=1 Tax=Foetidibacter luteolus TaxID=2608880 RepID=UPI00129A907B|nr:hypothetical protein [Foetidibacter luteolus]
MAEIYTIEVEGEEELEKLTAFASIHGIHFSVRKKLSVDLLQNSGQKLAKALEEIAGKGGLESFGDASEWQREVRKDRPLPGR